jgi:hypothetical protein
MGTATLLGLIPLSFTWPGCAISGPATLVVGDGGAVGRQAYEIVDEPGFSDLDRI